MTLNKRLCAIYSLLADKLGTGALELIIMAWRPWITASTVILDCIYEVPPSVIQDLWITVRPELGKTRHKKLGRDDVGLNEKAWHLGVTGYVQRLLFEPKDSEHIPHRVEVFIKTECHCEMDSAYYSLKMDLQVDSKILTAVTASSCSCKSSSESGNKALCKHILAVLHALRYLVEFGKVPEWPTLCTSGPQMWGIGRLLSGKIKYHSVKPFATKVKVPQKYFHGLIS